MLLLPPVEVCVERVRIRSNHGFSDEPATRKMHAEFAQANVEPRHVVADADASPETIAARIVDGVAAGQFAHLRPTE